MKFFTSFIRNNADVMAMAAVGSAAFSGAYASIRSGVNKGTVTNEDHWIPGCGFVRVANNTNVMSIVEQQTPEAPKPQ